MLEFVQEYCMDYVFLFLIALCLGAGVAGGLLSAWNCHRRLLALEENLKVILDAFNDRLNQLSKIAIRQDKSEAAKTRWSKKELEDGALAERLGKGVGGRAMDPPGHPWDPRTWGDPK
jgi:hypothetical protein